MPIIYLCMVVVYLIYLPRKIDGHTTGSQRVGFIPKDHSLHVTSRCQQLNMTPQDPTTMPMLYKNALLLALSTFVAVRSPSIGVMGDIINHGWRNDYSYMITSAAKAKLAQPPSWPTAGRGHRRRHSSFIVIITLQPFSLTLSQLLPSPCPSLQYSRSIVCGYSLPSERTNQ